MQHRNCKNCDRYMSIVKDGMCFSCAQAAKGLEGEAREKALALIKGKILTGDFRRGPRGPRGGADAREKSTHEIVAEIKADAKKLRKKYKLPDAEVEIDETDVLTGDGATIPIRLRLSLEIAVKVVN